MARRGRWWFRSDAMSSGWTAEVRLQQPDFGIRPYRAMLGTLRVQPDVLIRMSVPAPDR